MSGKNPQPECGHGSAEPLSFDTSSPFDFVFVASGFGYHEFGSSLQTPGDVASTKSHRRDNSTAIFVVFVSCNVG